MKKDFDQFGGLMWCVYGLEILIAVWFGLLLFSDLRIYLMSDPGMVRVGEFALYAMILSGITFVIAIGLVAVFKLKGKFFYNLVRWLMIAQIVILVIFAVVVIVHALIYKLSMNLWMYLVPLVVQLVCLGYFTRSGRVKVYHRIESTHVN
ncbi:hypothetical protein G7062_03050 [Erysipelothrix sp. HDW6C]|uniref:hypothetical protein n=1 Tax=Erysipelothrix sp. HDW6C TaxID=2714930 RepID=UPI00140B2714|nr:hypothetical protein [Erysipelothrix sp. HDW6C]QIK69333.1 hypothetical protein G7062_03050 [Erysipelothrix sp. HDW6C]